jgi:hypothetical protein
VEGLVKLDVALHLGPFGIERGPVGRVQVGTAQADRGVDAGRRQPVDLSPLPMLGCRPADRWDADRAAMLELPPVAPVLGWRATTRLPRDHYVRLDSNDYSVHPAVIGRKVEVGADLDQVIVTCQGKVVATHMRCWADHQTLTDPGHAEAAAGLRQARRLSAVHPADTLVEQRELTDYDRMLGITSEGVA